MIRSKETRDRTKRLLPRADLVYLEGEGHIVPRQTATIVAFLRNASPESRRSEIA